MGNEKHAYVAGFLDADGSFSLRAYERERRGGEVKWVEPVVQISGARREPLDRIVELAGGATYTTSGNGTQEYEERGYLYHRVQITGQNRLISFLPKVIPHLCLKRAQAEILLLAAVHQNTRGQVGYTDQEWEWFKDRKREVEKLNAHRDRPLDGASMDDPISPPPRVVVPEYPGPQLDFSSFPSGRELAEEMNRQLGGGA